MQKLLKAQYFMNEMHEYEIKSFSKKKKKKLEFNLDLPKSRFSINLSSKTQTLRHFASKSRNFNLGWPKQDHTQYNVPSLTKSNLCSVCN